MRGAGSSESVMKGNAMEADHKRASSSAPPTGGVTNPFEDSGPEAPSEPCEPREPSFPFEDSGPERSRAR